MPTSSPALAPQSPVARSTWRGRRIPGRLYLTEPDYVRFLQTAERPYEWKCGVGLYDEDGNELGEALPKDGYDKEGNPAMPTFRHTKLIREWLVRLDALLRGSGYEVVSEGLAVRSQRTGRRRFPDLAILPSPPQFEPDSAGEERVAVNPVVLIEVLSDSTEAEDFTSKVDDYLSIPSVTDYLIVAQDEPAILRYTRPAGSAPADGWHVTRHAGLEESVTLTDPAVTLTLAEIYARVLSA